MTNRRSLSAKYLALKTLIQVTLVFTAIGIPLMMQNMSNDTHFDFIVISETR